MALAPIVVELDPVGDPITGLWCPACALPSAAELLFAMYRPDGTPVGTLDPVVCLDCGQAVDRAGEP